MFGKGGEKCAGGLRQVGGESSAAAHAVVIMYIL